MHVIQVLERRFVASLDVITQRLMRKKKIHCKEIHLSSLKILVNLFQNQQIKGRTSALFVLVVEKDQMDAKMGRSCGSDAPLAKARAYFGVKT